MSLETQFRELQAKSAQFRQSLVGCVTVSYDNGKFIVPGYFARVMKRQKIENFGFIVPCDSVVRISKQCGFAPAMGKFIVVTTDAPNPETFRLRIDSLPAHPSGAEWVLGCNGV